VIVNPSSRLENAQYAQLAAPAVFNPPKDTAIITDRTTIAVRGIAVNI
jgi:hypothetical protein